MIPFVSSARTVLLMTDDALAVYAAKGTAARLLESAPWDTPGFAGHVGHLIAQEGGGAPVLVLADTTEQHYKKDTLVKASALDKAAMVQRKLAIAFPRHTLRGAMALAEKKSDGGALAQNFYILAALPDSQALSQTMAAVLQSGAQVAGVSLLPVESVGLVAELAARTADSESGKSFGWKVLLTQNAGGGLRQIVTKDGEMALTRMTPIVENPEADPHAWAEAVAREFQATVEYISRFGYRDRDPLHVMVVAPIAAGGLLENAIAAPCLFSCVTANDALRALDWPVTDERTAQAEALHVIWAGRKRMLAMPMRSPEVTGIARPRQAALAALVLLALLGAGQVVQLFSGYQSWGATRGQIEESQNRKEQLDLQYQAEVRRMDSLGVDILFLQGATDVYGRLSAGTLDFNGLVGAIASAFNANTRRPVGVSIEREGGARGAAEAWLIPDRAGRRARGRTAPAEARAEPYRITLRLVYPGQTDVNRGNTEVSVLRDRLQSALPDYVVAVTKFLKDYGFDSEVVIQSGRDAAAADAQQEYLATIQIVGPST